MQAALGMTSLTANLLRLLLANKWETHSSSDRDSLNKLNKGHTMPESKEIESSVEEVCARLVKIESINIKTCIKCTVRVALERLINSSEWNSEVTRRLDSYFCGFRSSTSTLPAACLLSEAMAWNNLAGVRCSRVAGKLERLKYWHAKLGRKFRREVTERVHYSGRRLRRGILINLFSQIQCLLLENPSRHTNLHEISKNSFFASFRPDNPGLPSQSSLAESLWQSSRWIPSIQLALGANGNVKAVLDVRHDQRAQKTAKHEHFKWCASSHAPLSKANHRCTS